MSSHEDKAKQGESEYDDAIGDLQESSVDEKKADEVKGGNVAFQDLHFVKRVDKSSPLLMQSVSETKPTT